MFPLISKVVFLHIQITLCITLRFFQLLMKLVKMKMMFLQHQRMVQHASTFHDIFLDLFLNKNVLLYFALSFQLENNPGLM